MITDWLVKESDRPECDVAMQQEWAGMSGAEAFMLIERHAENWDQINSAMQAWLTANLRGEILRLLGERNE